MSEFFIILFIVLTWIYFFRNDMDKKNKYIIFNHPVRDSTISTLFIVFIISLMFIADPYAAANTIFVMDLILIIYIVFEELVG